MAIQWFNSATNQRAYKYIVQARKNSETNYTTIVNRAANAQTDLVSDAVDDAIGRYVRAYVTGSTNTGAYAYPSIFELQVNGWYISSTTYNIDFSKKNITVPYSDEVLDIEDFLSNITFIGNENHRVESSAYYIVDGAQLIVTDSDNKPTAFTITIENPTGITKPKVVSDLFVLNRQNNMLHITLRGEDAAQLEVIDMSGKQLVNCKMKKEKSLHLPENMYIVKVYTDKEMAVAKYNMQ
ncbi:MAG: hypothetical protein QM751_10325 [Paludibacteraceae bacterium]